MHRLIKAMVAKIEQATRHDVQGEIFSYQAMFPTDTTDLPTEQPSLQAFKAMADPDSMYLHQAMKQPDADKFLDAMDKEVKQQVEKGVYSLIH